MYGAQPDCQGTFIDDLLQLCHDKERSFCAQCFVEPAQTQTVAIIPHLTTNPQRVALDVKR